MLNTADSIIQVPEKLKAILNKNEKLSVKVREIAIPFSDILKTNDLPFFKEYTDHGIKHIENTLQFAENLVAEETFQYLTSEEVGVLLLSVVLHDIGMHTNAEMFKNMIEGKYDNLVNLFPNGKTWKELWDDFQYDSQYWGKEKKNNVFGNPDHIIQLPNLMDLQTLNEYDKKLIGEFVRIHHCRIAHEVSINGYIGKDIIPFKCVGLDSDYIKIAGIVARSHGMDVRDTFDYLEGLSGDRYTPFDIHAVYLMVLLRLADYLQIDSSRRNENVWSIKYMYSPYSQLEHKTHESIKNVKFINPDKEKIAIQAHPKDAQTYVKIDWLTNDIQKEFDRSWAILGEVYTDYNYKLRYRRITANISNEKYKRQLAYVPQKFGFRYNNDLFKLLIAPLYGDDPSFGVRELVQNAVDACRLCLKDLSQKGEPHVKVEVDSQKKLFTITDSGKGMNLYEIENYFLTIGSSYNENIDWKKVRDQKHLFRTGRFGIGVLAAFLLGPEMSVVTKKRGEKEGGYRFTASMNNKFIQIEKELDAEYGTKIEIKCDETCIEKLRFGSEWYQWYIDKTPKVVYYYNGQLKDSTFDSSGFRELKHSSKDYHPVYWEPNAISSCIHFMVDRKPLYCNGFRISTRSDKVDFSLPGFDQFRLIHIPSLQITDLRNQLPLNLQRTNIEVDTQYEFEKTLAQEVFIDLMCQLMALDVNNEIKEFSALTVLNFHSDGFSIRSEYIKNFFEETRIIVLQEFDNNDLDKITQTEDFMHAVIQVTANDLRNTSGELISVLLKNWRKRDKPWDVYNRSVDGYFAVLDDNDQKKQILKQKFRDIVHFYKGWIYFAPTNSIEERLLEATITHFGGATIDFIIIKKVNKAPIQETCIDNLFEKYMYKNPVIPYDFGEREKKFPLLFQDYSEVIEQYRNKED